MAGKDDIELIETSFIPTSTPRSDHFVAAQSYSANTEAQRVLSGSCGHKHLELDEAMECAVGGGLKVVVHVRYELERLVPMFAVIEVAPNRGMLGRMPRCAETLGTVGTESAMLDMLRATANRAVGVALAHESS